MSESAQTTKRPQRKHRYKNKISYAVYINRVLRQVRTDGMGITRQGMSVVDQAVQFVLSAILTEAQGITRISGNKTIDARVMQTATQVILSGDLRKIANLRGTSAIDRFVKSA